MLDESRHARARRLAIMNKSRNGTSATDPEADRPPQWPARKVHGVVTVDGGSSAAGLIVRAFELRLRTRTQVGSDARTGDDGHYDIPYEAAGCAGTSSSPGVNLIVEVNSTSGVLVGASPPRFNVGEDEQIDVQVHQPDATGSEYERLLESVLPRLLCAGEHGRDLVLAELTSADINFLARETGQPAARLLGLIAAAGMAGEADQFPAAALYAWCRADPAVTLPSLLARGATRLIAELESAIGQRIVPADLRRLFPEIRITIQLASERASLDEPIAGGATSRRAILETSPVWSELTALQCARLGAALAAAGGDKDQQLIARLVKAGATEAQASSLHKTLVLSDLAQHHAPVVAALQALTANDEVGALHALAAVSPAGWVDMAYQHGTPAAGTISAQEYAHALASAVESLHPTATLVARLRDETINLLHHEFDSVADFLEVNPDIDIARADIDDIARERGLEAKPALKRGLQRLQRIRTLSATWREGQALINADIDSPSAILALDPDGFARALAGHVTKERAGAIHAQARALHDVSLALMVYGTPRFAGTPIAAMPPAQPGAPPRLRNHPTLRRMFGDLDYCQCHDCQSVLSPAAYFVDLLEFLRKPHGAQALDALRRRRPDLLDIELSCANAKAELPQIDLALEILENAVALPMPVAVPAEADVEAALMNSAGTGAPLPAFILDALALTSINVNDPLTVKYDETGFFDWVVSDSRRRWVLTNQRPTLWIRKPGEFRNSRAATLELRQITAAVAALDGKTLPSPLRAEMDALFSAEFGTPRKGIRFAYLVEVLEPGVRWKVTATMNTHVGIGRAQPTLTLAADGATSLSGTYSEPALAATRAALNRARIGGVLEAILAPTGGLSIEAQPDGDSWTLTSGPRERELVFQPALLTIKSLAYQSSSPDADLSAAPENRSTKAYQILAGAVFPWSLPFDLPLLETRATLDLLGAPRASLIALLRPDDHLDDDALAAEVLALSSGELELIRSRATDESLWKRWGLTVANDRATLLDTSVDQEVVAAPLQLLSRMSLLLQQARLRPSDLLDILATDFVASAAGDPVEIAPLDACVPSALTLHGLTAGHLDRIHRFVRLWRSVGWPAHVLDRALHAFAPGHDITDAVLRCVAQLQLLVRQLHLPPEVVVSFWSGFAGTVPRDHARAGEPEITPLYERLFLNKAVQNPLDTQFLLNSARSEMAATTVTRKSKATFLCAALALGPTELDLLAVHLPLPDRLSLASLLALFRAASLAKALQLGIPDYVRLLRLTSMNPFDSPAQCLRFCALLNEIRATGFDVDEVAHWLRHETRPPSLGEFGDDVIATLLGAVRTQLQAQVREQEQTTVPLLERVVAECSRLGRSQADSEQKARALTGRQSIDLPDDTEVLHDLVIPANLRDLVHVNGRTLVAENFLPATAFDHAHADSLYRAVPAGAGRLALEGAIDGLKAAQEESYGNALKILTEPLWLPPAGGGAGPLCTEEEAAELLGPGAPAFGAPVPGVAVEQRLAKVLARIAKRWRPALVVHALGTSMGVDENVAGLLLLNLKVGVGAAVTTALQALTSDAFVNDTSTITHESHVHYFELLIRFEKAVRILQRMGATASSNASLILASVNTEPLFSLDWGGMPVARLDDTVPTPPELLMGLQRLGALFGTRGIQRRFPNLLDSYATPASPAPPIAKGVRLRRAIAAAFELAPEQVDAAASAIGIDAPDQYRDPGKLLSLAELLQAVKRLGVSLAELRSLTGVAVSPREAGIVRRAFRARVPDDAWSITLKQLSDVLRVRQRDALVDYLLWRDRLNDADALFERYLIDVQMQACGTSTRILQATAAVQLFVQRCLLNLEEDVLPSYINAKQWAWMKHYRVWEANRRVFLFPENWVFPELRDDKTSAFQELEGVLAQGEPSSETARDALIGYLDALNDAAQIAVVGMYEDAPNEARSSRMLYVVGRTPNPPYRYYWRQCHDFGGTRMLWSGWAPLDTDVSGDHVIPFVLDGDLHVAWALIQKPESDVPPKDKWTLQIAWARKTAKGWTQKKTSRDLASVPQYPHRDERSLFAFRVAPSASGDTPAVDLACYSLRRGQELDLAPRFADGVELKVGPEPTDPATAGTTVQFWISVLAKHPKEPGEPQLYTSLHANPTLRFEGFGFDQIKTNNNIDVILHLLPILPTGWHSLEGNGPFDAFVAGSYIPRTIVDNRLLRPDPDRIPLRFRATVLVNGLPCSRELELVCWRGRTHVCHLEFVIPVPDAPNIPTLDLEAPLPMDPLAVVHISSSKDAAVEMGSMGRQAIDPVANTIHWMSGYREVLPKGLSGNPVSIAANRNVFGGSVLTGRYALAPCAPDYVGSASAGQHAVSILHFEEGTNRYFLRVDAAIEKLTVFGSGYKDVATYRAKAGWGLERLYVPELQATTYSAERLPLDYMPQSSYALPAASPRVSFDLRQPNALYQWELFYHAPLFIADYLSKQQRFDEAQRWIHYVFDPTTSAPPTADTAVSRFWNFLPFRDETPAASISTLATWLADPDASPEAAVEVRTQVDLWRDNPFMPHAVARFRRSPYKWRAVFQYLDNLIAWGDQLFRRDTREDIDEATTLYLLAAQILGPRPRGVAPRLRQPATTYRALLQNGLDDFSNAWVGLGEGLSRVFLAWQAYLRDHGVVRSPDDGATQVLSSLGALYFCVPHNDKLDEYWATVEDRLWKIRHCQNFDGRNRSLALYEPRIDPAILVRAAAAGISLDSVLADRGAALPHYRFNVLSQKASELCTEVKSLAAALLGALEKRDAEALSRLRAVHEIELLTLVRQVKSRQIDEATANLEALQRTREHTAARFEQYQRLLGNDAIGVPPENAVAPQETISLHLAAEDTLDGTERGLALNVSERDQLRRLAEARIFGLISGIHSASAGVAFIVGTYLDKLVPVGHALNAGATAWNTAGGLSSAHATHDSLIGGYERRKNDWAFQSNLATRELSQIDKQIASARIRIALAEQELANHDRQSEQSKSIEDFLRRKFTNQELQEWTVGQVSSVYFATYQLAYDLARKAERAYRYELGLADTTFIKFGYWDSLKKGLMSGERLFHDIKRMEAAYLDQNRREYELTKHISLLQVSPLALLQLRTTGTCVVSLQEDIFDMDGPGHFFRRIKSMAVTIPCVAGPYASVNCTLTLMKSEVRTSPLLREGIYERTRADEDPRFLDYFGMAQAVVTSSGREDGGLFEMNLRDERYLPFEGHGAISQWRLELPAAVRQFDYDTIADVILHMRYTAREGGEQLRKAAVDQLGAMIDDATAAGVTRLFSIREEFPNEWAQFRSQAAPSSARLTLKFSVRAEHYPLWSVGHVKAIARIVAFARMDGEAHNVAVYQKQKPATANASGGDDPLLGTLLPRTDLDQLLVGELAASALTAPIGDFIAYFDRKDVVADSSVLALSDVWIAVTWESSVTQ